MNSLHIGVSCVRWRLLLKPRLKAFSGSVQNRNYCLLVDYAKSVARNCPKTGLFSSKFPRTNAVRGFRSKKGEPETETVARKDTIRPNPKKQSQNINWKTQKNKTPSAFPFTLKTGIYTVGFTAVVFGGCAAWQYENAKRHHEEFWKRGLDIPPSKKSGDVRNELNYMWKHLSPVHKITYGIIGANFLVFLAWKMANPATMTRWFTLSIVESGRSYATMLLSAFSHKSGLHFLVNMYVLSSFCVVWRQLSKMDYGVSQVNSSERYLAFYLTAGMCSSFLSLFVKTLGRIPQASLGASGAIMGLIGYTCERLPNSLLAIVFLPNVTFTADSAKNFIILFDGVGLMIGALSRWRFMIFDHAGHLGGMLFGIWYARYGERILNDWSQYVIRKWRGKD